MDRPAAALPPDPKLHPWLAMKSNYDPWATHFYALALAIQTYGKRVLEVGAGWYSTPLIHSLSDQALSIENDPDYIRPFETLCPGRMILTGNVAAEVLRQADHDWDVVFVDCEKASDRLLTAQLFLNRKTCIVAHDTEMDYWQKLIACAAYKRHFRLMTPHTSFISNVLKV